MWLALTLSALAAPPGYKVTQTNASGCELSLGPAEADGTVPMRAECVWPDITLDTFKAKMAKFGDHDLYFTSVVKSDVRETKGTDTLVFQEHQASGISNREVLLWMSTTQVDGYERYGWRKAADRSLTPASGNVATTRDEGYWQAKTEGAGVRVVHMLTYDPGGSVPGFIVRWFQTSGLATNCQELHDALASGKTF